MKTYFKPILILFLLSLVSCQTNHHDSRYSPIRFDNIPTYDLDVGKVEVIESYVAPLRAPNVEHLFPVTTADAVKSWANDRITARGQGNNRLKIIINKASVVEASLPKTPGVKGAFINDQKELYKADLEVEFELYGNDPLIPQSEIKIEVTKSKSLAEYASPAMREKFFYDFMKDIINQFNDEFEKVAPQYFNSALYKGL